LTMLRGTDLDAPDQSFRRVLQCLRRCGDDDARALAAALRRAHAALSTRQRLTKGQAKAWANNNINVTSVLRFAEYAENGHFAIY
jgi:hypothetical protein